MLYYILPTILAYLHISNPLCILVQNILHTITFKKDSPSVIDKCLFLKDRPNQENQMRNLSLIITWKATFFNEVKKY